MNKKNLAIVLILIMAISGLSLLIVKPACAQSIPKPSVPEFTTNLEGPSFTRNTTYYLDSNTGQIVANIGYTNQYSLITITIKNQPFNPSYGSLYYNIQFKSQSASDAAWSVVRYDNPNPKQTTDSNFTNISLLIEGQWSVPSLAGIQADIQVQSMLGNFYWGHSNPPISSGWMFAGETSDWSITQTVNIPANIPLSPTQTPPSSTLTPTPSSSSKPTTIPTSTPSTSNSSSNSFSVPLSALIAVVAVFLAIIVALSLLLFRRNRKTQAP